VKRLVTKAWNFDGQSDFSNPFHSFLYTLSLAYGGAVRLRNVLYDGGLLGVKRLPRPVVSVGNVTAGGTGKTPMVIFLTKLLRERGCRPAVLSRGYKGKGEGRVGVVSDGNHITASPAEAGDEPFLIASSTGAIVLTGADRFATGLHAVERLGADILVLDDAFQHRRLFRDVDILLLDADKPFGNRCLLPRGPMREPVNGLKRADIIVLTGSGENSGKSPVEEELRAKYSGIPVFRAVRQPKEIVPLSGGFFPPMQANPPESFPSSPQKREPGFPPDTLHGRRVCAFAGIANPDSFRKTLASLGAEIAAFLAFPDHHRYRVEDIEAVRKAAEKGKCEIILTTEKDGVKLRGFPSTGIHALRVEMSVTDGAGELVDAVLERLRNGRRNRA